MEFTIINDKDAQKSLFGSPAKKPKEEIKLKKFEKPKKKSVSGYSIEQMDKYLENFFEGKPPSSKKERKFLELIRKFFKFDAKGNVSKKFGVSNLSKFLPDSSDKGHFLDNYSFIEKKGVNGIGQFETYGKDLEYVKRVQKSNPKTLWTIVETEDGLYAIPGYHYVNRMLYVVTKEKWKSKNEEYRW